MNSLIFKGCAVFSIFINFIIADENLKKYKTGQYNGLAVEDYSQDKNINSDFLRKIIISGGYSRVYKRDIIVPEIGFHEQRLRRPKFKPKKAESNKKNSGSNMTETSESATTARVKRETLYYDGSNTSFADYGAIQEDLKLIEEPEEVQAGNVKINPSEQAEKLLPKQIISYEPAEQPKISSFENLDKHSPSHPINRKLIPRKQYVEPEMEVESKKEKLEKELKKQAESARYSFATSFQNSINDNSHSREEVRDGLNVRGHYSYSDGYFKRTIHYVADENGYRVVQENVEMIGDGPIENVNGSATVNVVFNNQNPLKYSITGAELAQNRTKESLIPAFT